jgi:hypothetical protein
VEKRISNPIPRTSSPEKKSEVSSFHELRGAGAATGAAAVAETFPDVLLKNSRLLRFPHPSPFDVPKRVRLMAQDFGGLASGHF